MKSRNPGKIRTSLRQRMSYRMVLIIGIPVVAITFLLIIFFQFFKNETIKAEKRAFLTPDKLPVELVVDEMVIAPVDTNQRDGVRYKIAKSLSTATHE